MPQKPLVPNFGLLRHFAGLMLAIPIIISLFSTLLVFNALQTLSVVLRPISRPAFRAFNRFAADTWWGWCVTLGRVIYRVKYIYTGDRLPIGENALIVANHQEMTDITFLMALAKDHRQLGNLKWFVKDIIKYFPGIGWGLLFLDCLFVKRSWLRDKANIEKVFSRLTVDKVPFWIVTFSEGTRITESKLRKSRERSAARNSTPLRHVLTPRTSGFYASVAGLGDCLGAVYDITIGYPEGVPTLWHYIRGFARTAHLHVRRYPTAELPKTKDELSQWLNKRFEEKDELLEGFYRNGCFGPPAQAPLEG